MRCSARIRVEPEKDDLVSFLLSESYPCTRIAAFLGPMGQPLCEPCGLERKSAHDAGETIAAILQEKVLGRIRPYELRALVPETAKEAEEELRTRGVDVDAFLARSRERLKNRPDS